MVLNPDPMIPATKASKKYLENKLGMNELKKFIIDGKSEYIEIPPIKPAIQNSVIMIVLFIG